MGNLAVYRYHGSIIMVLFKNKNEGAGRAMSYLIGGVGASLDLVTICSPSLSVSSAKRTRFPSSISTFPHFLHHTCSVLTCELLQASSRNVGCRDYPNRYACTLIRRYPVIVTLTPVTSLS